MTEDLLQCFDNNSFLVRNDFGACVDCSATGGEIHVCCGRRKDSWS